MNDTPSSTLTLEPLWALFLFVFLSCSSPETQGIDTNIPSQDAPYLMVLGVAQDAGYPQAGSRQEFKLIEEGLRAKQYAVSLCLVDPQHNKRYLFEATPDFREQLEMADKVSKPTQYPFDGIFLTHAHIGHYTGLMHLGREVMGTRTIPVYAMPKMTAFLQENGPWSQLISLENIALKSLSDSTTISLSNSISVMPFTVPHRDEYSETVGYQIKVSRKSLVFIPDIDKWNRWDVDIREVVKAHDYILIDASFYKDGELKGRDMSLIPHPFTTESMELFKNLSDADKAKVYFIHANHTNPILDVNSREYKEVIQAGFHVAKQGQIFRF